MKFGELQHRGASSSFDALWEPDVRFVVDFDVEFKLKYKGTTFFGVDVSGRFTGPRAEARRRRVVDRPVAVLDLRRRSTTRSARTARPPRCPPSTRCRRWWPRSRSPGNWSADLAGRPDARHLAPARRRVRAPAGAARRAPDGAPARRSGSTASAAAGSRARSATTSRRRPSAGARRRRRRRSTSQFAAAEFLEPDRRREARAAVVRGDARGRDAAPSGTSRSASGRPPCSEMRLRPPHRRRRRRRPPATPCSGTAGARSPRASAPAARSALREPRRVDGPDARRRRRALRASRAPTTSRRRRSAPARSPPHARRCDAHLAANPDARPAGRPGLRRVMSAALPVPALGARGRGERATRTPTR